MRGLPFAGVTIIGGGDFIDGAGLLADGDVIAGRAGGADLDSFALFALLMLLRGADLTGDLAAAVLAVGLRVMATAALARPFNFFATGVLFFAGFEAR